MWWVFQAPTPSTSLLRGDDILIDAPFDGEDWYVVRADIDESSQAKWKIDINRQQLSPRVEIWGEGFIIAMLYNWITQYNTLVKTLISE